MTNFCIHCEPKRVAGDDVEILAKLLIQELFYHLRALRWVRGVLLARSNAYFRGLDALLVSHVALDHERLIHHLLVLFLFVRH